MQTQKSITVQSQPSVCCFARIYTFRSFVDSGWFPLGPQTSIIGNNGSGKTTVINALGAFSSGGPALKESVSFAISQHESFCDILVNMSFNIVTSPPPLPDTTDRNILDNAFLLIRRLRPCSASETEPRTDWKAFIYSKPLSKLQQEWPMSSDFFEEITGDGKEETLTEFGWLSFDFVDYVKVNSSKASDKLNGLRGRKWADIIISSLDSVVKPKRDEDHSVTDLSQWRNMLYCGAELKLSGDENGSADVLTGKHIKANAQIPHFISLCDNLEVASETSKSEMRNEQDHKSIKRWSGQLGSEAILSTLLGAAWSGGNAVNIANLANTKLETVALPQKDLNALISDFWEKDTHAQIMKEKGNVFHDEESEGWKFWLIQGKMLIKPEHLSRGGKWFFGFLAVALAARAHAKRISDRGNTNKNNFFLPPMLLLDEPATFLDLNRQRCWLDLVESLSSTPSDSSESLNAVIPWFGYSTHAPALIRKDFQVVLCVDQTKNDRDGINVQDNSSIVLSRHRHSARSRYSEIVSSLFHTAGLIGDPVKRILLEGYSDRDFLNLIVEVLFNPGERILLHTLPLSGVANKQWWNSFRDQFLRDAQWMSSTKDIVLAFDDDDDGRRGVDTLTSNVKDFWNDTKRQPCPWQIRSCSMRDLTGIQEATAEDLVPQSMLISYLEQLKLDQTISHVEPQGPRPITAMRHLREAAKRTGRHINVLKSDYLDYCLMNRQNLQTAYSMPKNANLRKNLETSLKTLC